ncbi:MAG: ATP-binding protein, partial [Acetobacteraceae bacterium]
VSATAALIAMHVLPASSFAAAARHFWIGDFTGVIGLFPALMSFGSARRRWRELRRSSRLLESATFALSLVLALWLVFGLARVTEMHFFYLLLLPVIWIGVRHGFALCAVAVLVEQISMIVVITWLDYPASEFTSFQMLSVTTAGTGLLVGAVVTGRERAEVRLRRQQAELDRITRLTTAGALGTAIVHQISQPLATIAAYIHACSRMLLAGNEDRAVVTDTMRKAEAEVLRAGAVIDRLRDVLSSGTIRAASLDLTATVLDVAAALGDEALQNGVDVAVEGRIAADVIADQIQIEQVIVNLVRNAIDAAASITGSARQVRIRLHELATAAEIAVEDSGPGVSPVIAERLFEVFETTKPQGMGLGLCLSRELVQRHGGRLWWDRGFTRGTRFVLHLPYDCAGHGH